SMKLSIHRYIVFMEMDYMNRNKVLSYHYLKVLAIDFVISIILYFALWKVNVYAVHSILESLCLFIAAAIFLIVWNTANEIPDKKPFLGFAILPILIFDAFHVYLFAVPIDSGIQSSDFAIKFWILARLTEVIVLYIVSLSIPIIKTSKWIYLATAIAIPFAIAVLMIEYPDILPDLLTESGLTSVQKVAEIAVVFIAFLSLLNIKKEMHNEFVKTYRYLLMVPLIIIASQIMFIIPNSPSSISWIYGHVLKITYYYYLYKEVFVSYVKYPYKMMEDKNKKLQEAYHQLELNRQEEERKHSLLIQQEKLALLGQMGAGIVHETRNYLTTIKGSCQLMEVMTKESNLLKHVKKINKSIDEIDSIISRFLYMSKQRDTEFEEVSICDLVQSVESLIMSTSFMKKIDITFETSKEERYLLCDEGQINQVVLNLCKNAVEAMEDTADPRLEIETGFNEEKNEMYIRVTDNGKGISAEELEKIGNAFYTTKKTGTGLGLYVCKQIVKEHGGRIEVVSKPGKGASFIVWLPCIDEEPPEEIANDAS
ncbi:MAG: MASE3 domain-containing protein, partial [Lutispora sp.]